MDISDFSLPELIERKDHLNILRYIRTHKLREPQIVLESTFALLGKNLQKKLFQNELARLSILEQACLAALDDGKPTLADDCLVQLSAAGISKRSTRYRLLLARCLEYTGSTVEAKKIYEECLEENPANTTALKRQYCLVAATTESPIQAAAALHKYLEQQWGDTAAWYELAKIHKGMGNWEAAAYCLEQVVLTTPRVRVELAECYATAGEWLMARQNMAAAVEHNPKSTRALMGLVAIANGYLTHTTKTTVEEMEMQVAEELVRYGAEKVLVLYKKNKTMFPAVKKLMDEYTVADN